MDYNYIGGSHENIAHLVQQFGVPSTVIEIGTYEGSTTFWLADNLVPHNKDLKIYTIDPHLGSVDLNENFDMISSNFEYNLSVCKYGKNIEYIKKYSKQGLLDLISAQTVAEMIYIDGDHRASTVLEDLVLAWQLLPIGGAVLCDDTGSWRYTDKNGTQPAQMCPRMAVEAFIQCNWHKIKILDLPISSQTAFVKLAE